MNINNPIRAIINKKTVKPDKNNDNFLILELDDGRKVLVFPKKVSEERWNWFEEGKEYSFTLEEGKNDNYLLVDFEVEINS